MQYTLFTYAPRADAASVLLEFYKERSNWCHGAPPPLGCVRHHRASVLQAVLVGIVTEILFWQCALGTFKPTAFAADHWPSHMMIETMMTESVIKLFFDFLSTPSSFYSTIWVRRQGLFQLSWVCCQFIVCCVLLCFINPILGNHWGIVTVPGFPRANRPQIIT